MFRGSQRHRKSLHSLKHDSSRSVMSFTVSHPSPGRPASPGFGLNSPLRRSKSHRRRARTPKEGRISLRELPENDEASAGLSASWMAARTGSPSSQRMETVRTWRDAVEGRLSPETDDVVATPRLRAGGGAQPLRQPQSQQTQVVTFDTGQSLKQRPDTTPARASLAPITEASAVQAPGPRTRPHTAAAAAGRRGRRIGRRGVDGGKKTGRTFSLLVSVSL